MKIYILTCIDENSTLVSCKPYRSLESASANMICAVMDAANEFDQSFADFYQTLDDASASIGNNSRGYTWDITESEI